MKARLLKLQVCLLWIVTICRLSILTASQQKYIIIILFFVSGYPPVISAVQLTLWLCNKLVCIRFHIELLQTDVGIQLMRHTDTHHCITLDWRTEDFSISTLTCSRSCQASSFIPLMVFLMNTMHDYGWVCVCVSGLVISRLKLADDSINGLQ